MPDVSRTEIGRRMYQVHKEKTVEKAVEKMRASAGQDWKLFTQDDVHLLERLLGAAWSAMDQKQWEKIPFAKMNREDVRKILDVARYIDIEKTPWREIADSLEKVLLPAAGR